MWVYHWDNNFITYCFAFQLFKLFLPLHSSLSDHKKKRQNHDSILIKSILLWRIHVLLFCWGLWHMKVRFLIELSKTNNVTAAKSCVRGYIFSRARPFTCIFRSHLHQLKITLHISLVFITRFSPRHAGYCKITKKQMKKRYM